MKRLALLTVGLALGLAGSAEAHWSSPAPRIAKATAGPSVAQSLRIADDWIRSLGLENPCYGDRLKLTWLADPEDEDGDIDGVANGWRWNGSAWYWDRSACDITLRKGLSGLKFCGLIGHEILHYAYGPDHTGPFRLGTRTVPPACTVKGGIRRAMKKKGWS